MTALPLRVVEVRREVRSVEVEFPVYRVERICNPGERGATYTRWEADGRRYQLTHTHIDGADEAWEIRRDALFPFSVHPHEHADFVLGRGEFACTAEQFNAALEQARAFLASVPGA